MDGFRTLGQGGRVAFDLVLGPKGDQAQNIRPVDAQGVPLTAGAPSAAA